MSESIVDIEAYEVLSMQVTGLKCSGDILDVMKCAPAVGAANTLKEKTWAKLIMMILHCNQLS